jgi:hypothetical protein
MTLFLLPAIYALWFHKSLGPAMASSPTPAPDFALPAPAE